MYFSSCDFFQSQSLLRGSPITWTFLYLCICYLKRCWKANECKCRAHLSTPIHSRITQSYEHQAPVKAPSFISLSALCATVPCSRIHLMTRSVKQADHLVQFNRELWEIWVWIRTFREKYSAEGPPFLFSLITLTLCKNQLSSYFLCWACGWGGQIRAAESLSAVSVL